MNRYFRILIAAAILFICGIMVFAIAASGRIKADPAQESVIISMNDIVKTAEERWPDLSALDSKNSPVGFTVISPEGETLYSAGKVPAERVTVESAIKNAYPYKYVTAEGNVVGIVIMFGDNVTVYRNLRVKLMIALAVAGIIMLLGMLGFGLYVHKRIILPFRRMEEFAGKIAEGKLDEPLAMEENNMFGIFTESFDIMREELAESKKRELALQKKERELVASLSHDLKTPITGIKLAAELLKAKQEVEQSPSSPDTIEKLDNIYMKADQIDVLVTDLFTSTLDDLGEFKVSCRDEESKVLVDIIKKYDDRKLVVSSAIPQVIINIDTRRMSQVIGNIISNSYKICRYIDKS